MSAKCEQQTRIMYMGLSLCSTTSHCVSAGWPAARAAALVRSWRAPCKYDNKRGVREVLRVGARSMQLEAKMAYGHASNLLLPSMVL